MWLCLLLRVCVCACVRPLACSYGPAFMEMGMTDVPKLLRMQDSEIESVLKSRFATAQHCALFLELLQEKRDEQDLIVND